MTSKRLRPLAIRILIQSLLTSILFVGCVFDASTLALGHYIRLILVFQFLEGLFQHTAHVKDFVTKVEGVDLLVKFYDLPSLPSYFHSSVAGGQIITVVRTMAEAVPSPTLEKLLKIVKTSLDETRDIWKADGSMLTAAFEVSGVFFT